METKQEKPTVQIGAKELAFLKNVNNIFQDYVEKRNEAIEKNNEFWAEIKDRVDRNFKPLPEKKMRERPVRERKYKVESDSDEE